MFTRQSGRISAWFAGLAALTLLGGWAGQALAQPLENAPPKAPHKQTVPDPIGDLDQLPGAAKVNVSGGAAKPVDESRMFFAILIVAAVFIIPVVLANYLSKALRMPDHFFRMAVVLFAIVGSAAATYFEWPPKLGIDLRGGTILIYEVEQKDFKEMDKLVTAVLQRVNPDGLKEVTVRPYGEREIEIILPEADQAEQERTRNIISKQGQMAFRIVADDRYDKSVMELARDPQFEEPKSDVGEPGPDGKITDVEAKWVPVSTDARYLANEPHFATRTNKKGELEVLVLVDKYNVTGDYLNSATPGIDRFGKPAVNFGFNAKGARLFGRLTGSNLPDPAHADLKRLLAIVLDDQLRSAPSINSKIEDRGEITGSFTVQETEDLAAVLTAGRLPTTLRKEPTSSLTTGPTLGRDTIQKGVYSMLVSTVAVVIFMLAYYRFAGLVANLALFLNVLLIVAFMILFHAAFTLSGLAGLALTVGMAVDANVLIYERMREELGRGATLRMAIRNGFDRATTTIVDANVTTLISAIVLYAIGTDQVKGFAVTLILGIVMNLFTAITFTRLLFDVAEKTRWITRLKFLHVMENPNFDFIGKRYIAIALSLVLIGIGLVASFQRGRGLLDIDFTGGVSVEALFEKPQNIADIRQRLSDLPDDALPDVTVQDIHISGEPLGTRFLIITSKSDIDETDVSREGPKTNIEWVEEQLKKAFNDADHRLAFNHVSWGEVTAIAAASPATDSKKAEAETPAADEEKSSPAGDKKADDKQETEEGATPKSSDEKSSDEEKQSRFRPGDEMLLALADEAASDEPTAKSDDPAEQPADEQKPAGENADRPAATEKPAEKSPADNLDLSVPMQKAGARTPPPDPFAGGSTTKLNFTEPVDIMTLEGELDKALKAAGHRLANVTYKVDNPDYEKGSNRGFKEWSLKCSLTPNELKPALANLQQSLEKEPFFPSSNKVGASVAGNTQLQAANALLASLVLIIVYVWIRFQQVSFGVAAVLALVHDVLVALGGLAISYWLANIPFMESLLIEPFKINLPIIAAFLTIIGYSINDTIVIFDRIREVRGKSPDMSPELVNLCVNQTLSRTLLTSLTVFIVVLILYIFGGQGIHGFAFTLVVGTISGTYSTVYIATPLLIWMNQRKASPGGPGGTAKAAAVGREAA